MVIGSNSITVTPPFVEGKRNSYLNAKDLHKIRPVCPFSQVGKVKLKLVPLLFHPKRHRTDKWFNPCGTLEVACSESTFDALIV